MREALEPLEHRRFRALWLASIFSNIGSFLQGVAASWLMLELTGSAFWVGLMAASATLPLLFLALPAGAIADRFERRKVLLVAQSLMGSSALAMALLYFLDLVSPGRLLALGLTLGVGLAINLPAWQALVPDLVPRGVVASAVALNSAAFNVARAVGPALGGLIVATLGPGVAFLLNALSYIGIIVVLWQLRLRGAADEPEPVRSAIAVGVRFARYTPPFRRLLAVAAGFAITSSVVQALLPNVTADTLGEDATTFGFLLGAMGAGALLGAFTRPAAAIRLGRNMVPASIVAFGTAGLLVGLSRHPLLTAAAMFVAGVFWVWTLATLNATVQLLAPQWVRGRAMSLYTLAFVGILPIGSILGGAVGDLIGPAQAVALFSAAGIALGLVWLRVGIPALGEFVAGDVPEDWNLEPHDVRAVDGGPVMVVNTWTIDEADLPEFLETMNELRLVRLRTGAYRWRLYRLVEDPHRMSEIMLLDSWAEHLRQHRRIDAAAVEVIRRARAFDRAGGPVTRHLVAVDVVEGRPDWEQLVATHDALHRTDGSIPLDREGVEVRGAPGA